MNTLIKLLATSVFMLGVQQVAVAETCEEAWRQSSASKSCGTNTNILGKQEITDVGNGQCKVNTYCSTNLSTNSYGNVLVNTRENIKRMENQNGTLVVK